jgi:hypothetical protein
MVQQPARKRRRLIGVSIVVVIGVLVLASIITGAWPIGGVPVQVFEPNSTLFTTRETLQGVLVCAPPGTWGNQGQAAELSYMHLVPATRILDQRGNIIPATASRAELRRGQRLRVWATSPLFSYPAQVTVERLIIESDGQGEPPACQWRGLGS